MAHSYTPGLRVTEHAIIRRERRLPLKGDVLVAKGDKAEARKAYQLALDKGGTQDGVFRESVRMRLDAVGG